MSIENIKDNKGIILHNTRKKQKYLLTNHKCILLAPIMTTDDMTNVEKDKTNKLNRFLTRLQTVDDDFIDKLCATDKSALTRHQHLIIDEAK